MSDVKVKGQPVTIDGATYVLPALPLVKMPDVQVLMLGGSDIFKDATYINCFIDALHWSLLRNYPDIDREKIVNHLDMTNYAELLGAFKLANGFAKATPAGEATASQ